MARAKYISEIKYYDKTGKEIFNVGCYDSKPDNDWAARKFRKMYESAAVVIMQHYPKTKNKPIIIKKKLNPIGMTTTTADKFKKLGVVIEKT